LELKANSNLDDLSLPETVTVLDGPSGSKVYIVGTSHFSEKSQNDVIEVCLVFAHI
jgi:traB